MTDIEIDVDGIPVEVDAAEYEQDPAACITSVQAARAEAVGDLTGLHEISPDYDELVGPQ